jgi:hypothetical protein
MKYKKKHTYQDASTSRTLALDSFPALSFTPCRRWSLTSFAVFTVVSQVGFFYPSQPPSDNYIQVKEQDTLQDHGGQQTATGKKMLNTLAGLKSLINFLVLGSPIFRLELQNL